jgi:hypothetical protein
MEVVLLLSTERDLQEPYNWVEEHRRGRGHLFLQDVGLRLEHLQKFPLSGDFTGDDIAVYSSQDTLWYLLRCRVKQDFVDAVPRSPARSRKVSRALFRIEDSTL